jgi:hypothetical protein
MTDKLSPEEQQAVYFGRSLEEMFKIPEIKPSKTQANRSYRNSKRGDFFGKDKDNDGS